MNLKKEEVRRYGRQLILPEWGVQGQSSLKSCSVLVVGVGGLGCPASLYLAGAGVGLLGLLDYDVVELSNLHRQVLHIEQAEGKCKPESAQVALNNINSLVKCRLHQVLLCKENAMDILCNYDIILDCTDNVATRYLLNDACVLLGKTLVSGSALRFEGQLTVYHYAGGPCYRCLFPRPPPPRTVTSCSEGGVMGPVPGIIGTMQALEVLKIVAGAGTVLSGKMFVFDGLSGSSRTVQLRGRQSNCAVCGDSPSITALIDYQVFCGSAESCTGQVILAREERISCSEYHSILETTKSHLLLDVRSRTEFEICHLNNAVHIPLKELTADAEGCVQKIKSSMVHIQNQDLVHLYVCCRHGNDSQLAVLLLKQIIAEKCPDKAFKIQDLIGGLNAWADQVDNSFPMY